MKNAILLKFLQSCHAKPTPNLPNTISKKGDKGFTLLEVVVIALILGILAAIAAPGWLGFINRQRVRTVNDRVFQTLRFAQSEAKRTKSDIIITFSDPSVDPPTATIDTNPPTINTNTGLQNPPLRIETFNGGGEIKPGQVQLAVNVGVPPATSAQRSLIFKFNGAFDPNDNPPTLPFYVTVSTVGGGTRQCVIVDTLLGGMRTAEGNDPVTGCP